MTEQRECEGHGEHRIPNVFLSFLTLNRQKFQIFKACYVALTFFPWYNVYIYESMISMSLLLPMWVDV